ncbi:hypothetical protein ABEB36_007501 [Hypothenemus hampei]|uniref:Ig-like domain-containing protein n=1 Tax=Hypothenemus hampei TaxID=57062 RepID=A0ABD1EWK9_HYPHA
MPAFNIVAILGFLFYFSFFAGATLTMKQIVGPDSIEVGSTDELILDCDFEAPGEEDVVLKWFFNGLENQIYQWITSYSYASVLEPWKDLIDSNYRISKDPNSMLRALKFKEINPGLSGNYTCKVDSNDEVQWISKQIIVYSPATSFQIFLVGGDDEFHGNEVVLCDATNIYPKPNFDVYLAGDNGTIELPSIYHRSKEEIVGENGFYNVSIRISFNSSHLDYGTTKFLCILKISGTNYTETKNVEYFVDNGTQGISLTFTLLVMMLSALVFL